MKKRKIVIAVLLCLVFITPLFGSCKTGGNNSQQETAAPATNADGSPATTIPAETKDPAAPELPKADMGGKTFNFLTCGWGDSNDKSLDIGGEEQTGDPIDDAAYNRRIKIEQEYNVKIKNIFAGSNDALITKYQTSILAADKAYDAAVITCVNFTSMLTGNFLTDFSQLTYVDMNKPYWDKNFYDSMSVLGKHFAADGDISKRRLECVWIMAFNKDLIQSNGMDSPYDLVKTGQWTYGKMQEMAKAVAKDLNGDGKMTLQDDLWGLNYTGDTMMGIINSSGVKIAEVNKDGVPELTLGTEVNLNKLMQMFTDMRNQSYSIDTLFKVGGGLTGLGDVDIFADNRCLFLACATHNVNPAPEEGANNTQGLRSLNVNLGIIPYPKWDASQAEYTPYTAGNYHPALTVPQTNDDLDNTGILLEAMSYEGMKNITPAFYENLLKTKTARDDESADMLDFIFGNLQYDIGNMYNLAGITGEFGYNMSTNLRANIVSTIDKNINKWQSTIDKLMEQIRQYN